MASGKTTSSEVPGEAVALFRGPPEGFIAARNSLAAGLRERGRDAEATAVKALRKPTLVAWALNQLAERDGAGVQALLDSGAEVRAAQQAAISSKRGATERLRTAGAGRRVAVTDLASVAVAALSEAGKGAEAHVDAIVHALETCSVDEAAGAALATGTLERPPHASPGFGGVFGLTPLDGGTETGVGRSGGPRKASAGAEQPVAASDGGVRKGGTRAEGADVADLRAEVARRRRDRDGALRRARKAKAASDGFAHELEGMRRRLEVVERKHAKAAAEAAEGELEAARATRALREATERLQEAGRD